ncbi:MAG: hypothetical protein HYV28_20920 [Ignavibacteriales bacterium]|nr:hypothetical protein [Ignavibacteriales bacterium]
MKQLLHILRYKILSFFVVSFDGSIKTLIKNTAAGAIYTGFAIGMYILTKTILHNLIDVIHLNLFLFHRFVAIILFIFFLSVNAGNILVSISGLFKSKEINYLFTKPIPFANVFLVKFFDNFFYSSSTLFVILFAVVFAYGNFFSLGIGFYFVSVLALFLPFTLIAALLGALLLFFLLWVTRYIGIRYTVLALIGLYIVSVVLFFAGNNPTEQLKNMLHSEAYAMQYFQHLDSPILKSLPNYWVSNSLYWYLKGDMSYVLGYSTLLYTAAALLLIINYSIAKKYYYKAYIMASELRLFREDSSGQSKPIISFEKRFKANSVYRFLLKKELALFFRDPSQVLQLSFMIVLIILFASSITGKPHDIFISLNPFLQTAIYLVFILFNAFFMSSLALRFIFPHQGLEGEAYWKILSAPVNKQKLLTIKFLFYFAGILILSQGLNYFSHRKFSTELLIFSTILTGFISFTVCAVNYGFGIYYANYKERNPIRAASSQGASAAFLICLLYLGIIIAIMFKPLYHYFITTGNLKLFVSAWYFWEELGVVFIISCILSAFTGALGYRQSKKDFLP